MPHVCHQVMRYALASLHLPDLRPGQPPQINMFHGCDEETAESMLIASFSLAEKGEAADFYRLADARRFAKARYIAGGIPPPMRRRRSASSGSTGRRGFTPLSRRWPIAVCQCRLWRQLTSPAQQRRLSVCIGRYGQHPHHSHAAHAAGEADDAGEGNTARSGAPPDHSFCRRIQGAYFARS